MAKIKLLFALLIITVLGMHAQAQEIATFSRSSFGGWTYVNNAGIDLDAQSIGRGRIVLYTVSAGNVRELISPILSCQDVDDLTVKVSYRTQGSYIAERVTLKVALCSVDGHEHGFELITVPGGIIDHELSTQLAVPADAGVCQLRFTAPYADIDNCGAVMEVHVFSGSEAGYQTGDVNGDGIIDVDDVNALINVILGNNSLEDFKGEANVDGQGVIDVDDVNAVINLILKS